MIKEHDRIVLTSDLGDERLAAGDIGTVVHVYAGGRAYEVEFVALDGSTVGVVTVESDKVRAVGPHEIANARALPAA